MRKGTRNAFMGRRKKLASCRRPRYTENRGWNEALACPPGIHAERLLKEVRIGPLKGYGCRIGDVGERAFRDDLCNKRFPCAARLSHRFAQWPIAGRKEVISHVRIPLWRRAQAVFRKTTRGGRALLSDGTVSRLPGAACCVWGPDTLPMRQTPCWWVKRVPDAIRRGWGLGRN